MRWLDALIARWNAQSLAVQFLLTGSLVSIAAALLVGALVTSVIEQNMVRSTGAATALYVDSVIAPLLPDMQRSEPLDDTVSRALDETLGQGALGARLVSFRLWRRDGTILYASEKDLIGKRFEPGEDLTTAFEGRIIAHYDHPDDLESAAEKALELPLLEIYNPVLQPWTGEVVAVSEFYEIATDFEDELAIARWKSWAAVIAVTAVFFLSLLAIVLRGSRTISDQRQSLRDRISQLSELLDQNENLRRRIAGAAQRATALNETFLRRVGADLHDGPAQLVALASLRLDSRALTDPAADPKARDEEIHAIRASLEDAMTEIRNICNGLVLPQIENADLAGVLKLAVRSHEQRTQTEVRLELTPSPRPLSLSEKICIYRFVQETLSNAYRHAGGAAPRVAQSVADGLITVEVSDDGPGFDPATVEPDRLGLAGLRERVESIGGRFILDASAEGTRVGMTLTTERAEERA